MAAAAAEAEAPECYICMEPESALMPFLTRPMCACSAKADSTLKVHQLCLELSRDSTGKCAVCKTPLSGDWAFDQTFERDGYYYESKRIFTQMKGEAKHGSQFTLKLTNAHVGPIRWLAARGQYVDDKLHGPQFTYAADGSAATERNYENGVLHGALIERDSKGVVGREENYVAGNLHGSRRLLYKGIYLTGQYDNGVKVGQHLEPVYKKERIYSDPMPTLLVNKANYKAGVLDGPFLQYHITHGESKPLETSVYREGKLHGLQEKWGLNSYTLAYEQTEENHWIDGLRNGRQASFCAGQLVEEIWYHMGHKHGLDRRFWDDGQIQQETTWHLGEKHGRYRYWTREKDGKRILQTDAAYDNGFRHGRFVTLRGGDYYAPHECVTEEFWSDGTKEVRHGVHRIEDYDRKVMTFEANYKMGVLHGHYIKRDSNDSGVILNFHEGKLHGRCRIIYWGIHQVDGNFVNGVPVGQQTLFTDQGKVHECLNYDEEGRLHGRCVFNQSNGTPFQVHNYEHGVLHGRQVIYYPGTKRVKRVFYMRKGYVHGRFIMYDERGAEEDNMLLKEDEGITLQECLGKDALCAPSERQADGSFANRWTRAEGGIFTCRNQAAGNECKCSECYVPPVRSYREAQCRCGYCTYEGEDKASYDSYSDDEEDLDEYYSRRREEYRDRYSSRWY